MYDRLVLTPQVQQALVYLLLPSYVYKQKIGATPEPERSDHEKKVLESITYATGVIEGISPQLRMAIDEMRQAGVL